MPIKKQRGFTVVEMVVAIGLTGLMVVVLAQLFFSGHALYRTQNAELNINFSARKALDDIDMYVKQATTVANSYSSYITDATTLVLEVQSVGSTNQLIPGIFDTIVFYQSGDKIFRETVPGMGSARPAATVLLAENVQDFGFTYDSANNSLVKKVTTYISLLETTGRENQSLTVSTTSSLRN